MLTCHEHGIGHVGASRPKLIVAGFFLADQSTHHFNELLGYKLAAEALDVAVKIMVPRVTDPRLAAALCADPVLDPLPIVHDVNAENAVARLVAFTDAMWNLDTPWPQMDTEDPSAADFLLFPTAHPLLIRGLGLWLAGRAPERRPHVSFRFVGAELFDPEGRRLDSAAPFYRLACADLCTRPGQERVFLLANNAAVARAVRSVCCRRAFLLPMPKYLGEAAANGDPTQPTVYVHLNPRSGRLIHGLSDIIRLVSAVVPSVRFLVKYPRGLSESVALDPALASIVDVLPVEQHPGDYLAEFSRCTVVLLAYEARAYASTTSGVFTEAAGLGKPIVVPGGTWMAQEIAAGRGVGRTFEEPTVASVAAALVEVLQASNQLGMAARALAPQVRQENSCLQFIKQMMALAVKAPDMTRRYPLGEEIDFSDVFDSRYFMREGWGDTEPWGVWTIGQRATLTLLPDEAPDGGVILNAFAQPFLTRTHSHLSVRVSAAGQQVAEWVFDIDDPHADRPRWCEASLPVREGDGGFRALDISFAIDAPTSPVSQGLSADLRTLGLGLRKLSLTPATSSVADRDVAPLSGGLDAGARHRRDPGSRW